MKCIYGLLTKKAGEISNMRESDCKNMEIQQFMFDIKKQEIFYVPSLDSNVALFKISDKAYKYYITKIRNNENDDLYKVRRKLTRNILTGEKAYSRDVAVDKYVYGNLHIYVNRINNEIVWLKNHKKLGNRLYISYNKINNKLKDELNEVLGLN